MRKRKAVSSLEEYIHRIREIRLSSEEVLLYRGHSNPAFTLVPSLLREKEKRDAEHEILRELVATHPAEFASDTTTFDQLVRVQHYSLPTRLLDITWNPLVALFFAVNKDTPTTGEVIAFRIKKKQIKFFDSDTVSCVANLAHLKSEQKEQIDFTLSPKRFNEQKQIDRLLQFIRAEKPYFRGEIVPNHLKTVLCVKPKQSNRRIVAQTGAFLLFGLVDELEATTIPDIKFEKFPVNNKPQIFGELERMAINDSTMFPEIEKAALYITRNLKPRRRNSAREPQ